MRPLPLAFALVLTVPSAAAARPPLELSMGAGVLEASSPSMDAVTDDDQIAMSQLRLALGADVLGPAMIEVGWRVGSTEARDFNELDARLELHDVEAALRLERPLGRRLRGFVRAGGAITFGSLTITSATSTLTDDARTVTALAGVGLDVDLVQRPRFDLGLRLEAGVRESGGLAFHPARDVDGDDARIRSQGPSLGEMDSSGLTAGVTVFARF